MPIFPNAVLLDSLISCYVYLVYVEDAGGGVEFEIPLWRIDPIVQDGQDELQCLFRY